MSENLDVSEHHLYNIWEKEYYSMSKSESEFLLISDDELESSDSDDCKRSDIHS